MRINYSITCIAGLSLFSLVSLSALAQTPAVTFDNLTGQMLGNPPFTLGFEFTANANVSVSALGLFDDSQDGLNERHELGLFNSGGTLLASTILGSGTANPLTNQFRYASIAPVNLIAGQNYRIGGVYATGSDLLLFPNDAVNFATDSQITFVGTRFAAGSSLADPTSGAAGNSPGYFGPNLLISPAAAVPEPGSIALLVGMSATGLLALRRRRK